MTPVTAASRARRQATVVAAFGAVVPTVLAAQGMTSLAMDLLGFSFVVAVALAGFLELALVSSALLARAAALAGRPGGADAVAVWVVSATSGVLSGLHELILTTPAGTSSWQIDPGSMLAAAVRAVAPLVAAWLWERVLQAARAEQAERTLAEVRRDRRLLDVARAALIVRRLDALNDGQQPSWRLRRARRRLDKAHLAALRATHPGTTLTSVLTAVGQVDHLPAATSAPDVVSYQVALSNLDVGEVAVEPAEPLPVVAEPVVAEPVVVEPVAVEPVVVEPVVAEPVVVEPVVAEPEIAASPVEVSNSDTGEDVSVGVVDVSEVAVAASPVEVSNSDTGEDVSVGVVDVSEAAVAASPSTRSPEPAFDVSSIDVALDLLRRDRTVSGARIAAELSRHRAQAGQDVTSGSV